MPIVTVKPINQISVKVNQQNQQVVHGTTSFVGAADVQQQVNQIAIVAQNALNTANSALSQVDSKYDKTGGTITGNVEITNNLTVDNLIYASSETIDAGTF